MAKLDPNVMANFYGTEIWFRHSPLFRDTLYTEGVKYVADTAGAYWLLDIIASCQKLGPKLAARSNFQTWTLKLGERGAATLTCGDGNGNTLYTQEIAYTDFPEPSFVLWCVDGVILLPSEY